LFAAEKAETLGSGRCEDTMVAILPLTFHKDLGANDAWNVKIYEAVIAGWTGRDAAEVEKHIKELEALGVKRPSSTPVFYRVAPSRLTVDPAIDVLGSESSGEVEIVLLQSAGALWVGIGSDHTDREVEKYNVSVSKQICDKPVSRMFWSFDDVAAHWDRLILRSFIVENGNRVAYQEGSVAAMRHPEDLIQRYSGGRDLPEGTLMFCGTLGAKGGVRSSAHFAMELEPMTSRPCRSRDKPCR
jgi:hypothetical protein